MSSSIEHTILITVNHDLCVGLIGIARNGKDRLLYTQYFKWTIMSRQMMCCFMHEALGRFFNSSSRTFIMLP